MISLIFPLYNEENRIQTLKKGLYEYQNPNKLIKEIIFVNDGSTDKTLFNLEEIKKTLTHFQIQIISLNQNKGKGNAIKTGIFHATEPWILCNDADLSYPMNQIDIWFNNYYLDFKNTNTVYFGSRELGASNGKMKLFFHRVFIGRIYAILIRLITGIRIKDTQCGFKLYRSDIAKQIFQKVEQSKYAFDVEVHYLLKKQNTNIKLLPVICIETKGSKVNLIKDSWQMFWALFKIKKQHNTLN